VSQHREVEIAPDHGGVGQGRAQSTGEVTKGAPDRRTDVFGHSDSTEVDLVEGPTTEQEPRDFVDEERVAFGLPMDRARDVRRRSIALTQDGDELLHLLAVESGEGVVACQAHQGTELPDGLLASPMISIAVGSDDQNAGTRELPSQESEQIEGGAVGPMKVGEHQQERVVRRGAE
jgi:hypothetical protein